MSWSVRIVCSPRPSLPITIRQPLFADRRRSGHGEQLGEQVAVEVGDDLGDDLDPHALPPQHPHLRFDRPGGGGEVVATGSAVDARRDHLRIAGDEAQEIDVLEHADIFAVVDDRDAALVVLGHPQQRARDEIVGLDRDDVVFRQIGDAVSIGLRSRIVALASRMPVSRPTRAPSRTNRALVLIARIVSPALAIVSVGAMKTAEMPRHVAHPRAEQRAEARRLLVARRRFELARNLAIEEGGETVVVGDELEDQVARREVAQRLLARDEGVRSAALDESATVEAIARAAQADDFVAVALLDAALDDDVERVRGAVAGDQGLAGAEIADVERRFDRADLLRRQPVERRIGRIERRRHRPAAPRPKRVLRGWRVF